MSVDTADFNGEIKWLRMGNGSYCVDAKYTKELVINQFINGFIELHKNDEELMETLDQLIGDSETFVQRMSNHKLKKIV